MANIKISELNELTQKANNDYVPIVDTSADETKKISVKDLIPSNVTLLAVSSVEPEECYTGDKYFNTTTNLIYTAIERNVWSTTGEQAQMGINYIVFDTQTAYAYDGTTLVSVGGGSGGETLPVGSEIDFDGQTSDIPVGWEQVDNVLYENASGSSSNITLNDSVSNYNKIDIVSAAPSSTWDNYGVEITTIYPNVSTKWVLMSNSFGANWGSINREIITISGTSLTRGTSYKFSASNGSIANTFSPDTANKAVIYKVVGYK